MEKLWNIIKIIGTTLIVLAFIIGGILFNLSGKAERNYQRAIAYSNNNEWSSALDTVEKIPYYKNSSELYSYIYPIKMFYNKYETAEETLENYNKVLFYIKTEMDNINKIGDEKYVKDINDLQNVIAFKTKITNIKAQDEALKKNLTEAVELLKQGNIDGASDKLHGMAGSIYDGEKNELIKYIALQRAVASGDQKLIITEIGKLSPSYSGVYAGEIKQSVQAYVDMTKWTDLYVKASNSQGQADAGQAVPQVVQIPTVVQGMSRDELVAAYGAPSGENVLQSRFGSFIEMIYGVRVIYLEDNKVVIAK
jgi:hypothetical protein